MSARIIFLNLCLAMLCASQAKAQIIVSDGTKIQNDTIGEAQLLVQYETRCIINPEKPENVTEETMMLEVGKTSPNSTVTPSMYATPYWQWILPTKPHRKPSMNT